MNQDKFGVLALFLKLGPKILTIFGKLIKGLKFTKVGLAAASFGGYALLFSWKFALLLMIAVGFHESGHVWAMKKVGIKTKGFYFIPFIGGAAIAENDFKSQSDNVYMSIMGPVWGAILAWACLIPFYFTGNLLWIAAAGWMAFLNLFNMLPIHPLDGGRIIGSVAHSMHKTAGYVYLWLSLCMMTIIAWKFKIGLLMIMGIICLLELAGPILKKVFFNRSWDRDQRLHAKDLENGVIPQPPINLDNKEMLITMFAYFLLIGNLLFLSLITKGMPGADIAHQFLQ